MTPWWVGSPTDSPDTAVHVHAARLPPLTGKPVDMARVPREHGERAREVIMGVDRQVHLRFGASGAAPVEMEDLSAVHGDGYRLWLAGGAVPRLRATCAELSGWILRRASQLPDRDFIEFPDGDEEEVDAEGVDRQGDYVWLAGTHRRSRKRVDPSDLDDDAVEDLAKVRDHPTVRC